MTNGNLPTDQVNAICQYMQDNDIELSISKKQYVKQMFAILNIDYSDSRYRTVLDIYIKAEVIYLYLIIIIYGTIYKIVQRLSHGS